MTKATYKDAGVDLALYDDAIERIQKLAARTYSPRVRKLEDGFAGLFDLDFANRLFSRHYKHPVLVSCTDGVGTKLKLATMAGVNDTVGIDLVAMSVNDCICLGAEPLFFLDYVAMSHDDPPLLESIVRGVTNGCLEADCALLGGETAIMPDLYARGDYDLAGFCVGVVEERRIIDGSGIVPGDLVVGVASSGLHSNGYSLVRKIVFEMAGLKVTDEVEELRPPARQKELPLDPPPTVGQVLLTPTRIYARPLRKVLSHYKVKAVVHGLAHITGGGLADNLVRILPETCCAVVKRGSWDVPSVFPWLKRLGNVDQDEMERVFNMGIGFVLVVSDFFAESIRHQLADDNLASWIIGRIEEGEKAVRLDS